MGRPGVCRSARVRRRHWRLTAAHLPTGTALEGTTIPDGAEGTLLTVSRGDGPAAPALVEWVGRAGNGHVQPVTIAGHALERLQPWLASEIGFAGSTAKGTDFQVDWRGLASDAGLVPAGKLLLPIKLVRPNGDSPVRLTLLTSQGGLCWSTGNPIRIGQLVPSGLSSWRPMFSTAK